MVNFGIIQHTVAGGGLGAVCVSKVKGHVQWFMARGGQVRASGYFCDDQATIKLAWRLYSVEGDSCSDYRSLTYLCSRSQGLVSYCG